MDTFNYQEYLRKNPLLEDLNEEMGDVRAAWPTLTDDQKIDLLTGVWDDSDEAEKHFEKDFDNLPEAAKQNMYMDMMRSDLKEEEGEFSEEEDVSSLFKEKQMVKNPNRILELIQMYVDNYSDEGMSAEAAIRKIDELLQGNLDGYDKSFMDGEEDQY
jgi:hypothetical protein